MNYTEFLNSMKQTYEIMLLNDEEDDEDIVDNTYMFTSYSNLFIIPDKETDTFDIFVQFTHEDHEPEESKIKEVQEEKLKIILKEFFEKEPYDCTDETYGCPFMDVQIGF